MTFAMCAEEDDFYKVTRIVNNLLTLLEEAYEI